jgi:hypothetical protein
LRRGNADGRFSCTSSRRTEITDKGAFLPQFLAYLYARKWLLLIPIVVIGLVLILAAAMLFGSDVALKALYQIF